MTCRPHALEPRSKNGDKRIAPVVFLDFDDVICLGTPYSGFDVFSPDPPEELWSVLFHPPAIHTLQAITTEFEPRFVITTSWLRLMEQAGFEQLFQKTGLQFVAERLHAAWEAPQDVRATRHAAVARWLAKHHRGEPYCVLDDLWSGSGFRGSRMDKLGRVVLCEPKVGLQAAHLPLIRIALKRIGR